jgi:hypothetical protein
MELQDITQKYLKYLELKSSSFLESLTVDQQIEFNKLIEYLLQVDGNKNESDILKKAGDIIISLYKN